MRLKRLIKKFKKEAYSIPILLSLFLVPLWFNPFFIHSFTQGKELLFKTLMILGLLLIIPVFIHKKEIRLNNIVQSPIFLLLLAQIFIYATTDAISKTPIVTWYGTYSRGFGFIVELFLFGFTLYAGLVLSGRKLPLFLKTAFISGTLVALYAALQKMGIELWFKNYDTDLFVGRVFSFLGNPGYLGQFMLLNTMVGGYLTFMETEKKKKILYATGTLLSFIVIVFSETRAAILSLMVVLLLIGIKNIKKIIKTGKRHSVAILAGCIILGTIFLALPHERYSLSGNALRSLKSRGEIWQGTLNFILKKPALGYGGETFHIYFPEMITKEFLTLEEDLSTNADRVHNETLEIWFSHGIAAVLIYLTLGFLMLKTFFKTNEPTLALLSLAILANFIQNQLSFSDFTISLFIAFCLGGLIARQSENTDKITFTLTQRKRIILIPVIMIIALFLGVTTVYRPYRSELAYAESHKNYSIDYAVAVQNHKKALDYTPYYSDLWYELMFIDPSNMERALFYLEQIEGNSGNVMAWKGNFYSKTDPQKASEWYTKALEKNPYHPNWIRAFADMLYANGDRENALYLYSKYLESIPDFWKWENEVKGRNPEEQKSYRIFMKNTPYLKGTLERINGIIEELQR